jgi:excisionase family DNA binding protein
MTPGAQLAQAMVAALDDQALDALADLLAPRIRERLVVQAPAPNRWLSTREAAEYLGITPNALHKLTSSRAIPFAQDGPGAKCWFRPADLDEWRMRP